jgi:hypothetical protein
LYPRDGANPVVVGVEDRRSSPAEVLLRLERQPLALNLALTQGIGERC